LEPNHQVVKKIALAHNVTSAQVGMRWITQQGHVLVTASSRKDYDIEDLDLGFNLTVDEMQKLQAVKTKPANEFRMRS
jgi:diketogulonate reductase-like aldo/keto reductase